jgi:hypothetical protein
MFLDVVRWEVIKRAALRRAPDGTRLRASAFKLLTAMLASAQEQEWQDNRRIVTWPCYRELTRATALIAFGLIAPLAGHKRGGNDPIAAYEVFTRIRRSSEQARMAEHRHELRKRHRQYKEDRRAALAMVNGHV